MFRKVRFECVRCGDGFVDWHDDEWERTPVYCVNCGSAIVAGDAVDLEETSEPSLPSGPDPSARALGVLKSGGGEFRDTIPGLRIDPTDPSDTDVPESSRDTQPGVRQLARRAGSKATSSAPGASTRPPPPVGNRPRWAPVVALLMGFAVGIPLALFTEDPVSRLLNPEAHARTQFAEQLTEASGAIDQGKLDLARSLLERIVKSTPASVRNSFVHFEARVSTLRARLALAMILADRSNEVASEVAALQNVPGVRPSGDEVRRVLRALQPAKPAATAAPTPALSAEKPPVSPAVARRNLLTFARDRQRRALLNDAQRLYEAVLRYHPNDAEARCGLAEVELLRGGVEDSAQLFERALRDNPRYVPAWVGLADIDWARGQNARAACRYRTVIDRFPAGSYPPYIVQRAAPVSVDGEPNGCS